MVVAANMTRRDIGHIIYQNDENFLIYNLPSLEEFYIIPIDLTSILLSASQTGFLSLLLGRVKIGIKLVRIISGRFPPKDAHS